MYKWVIVGGGIQGITMVTYLLKQKKISSEELLIIDPHSEPLANWHRCTHTISMPFLRSPGVHHLDVNPFSLDAFVKHNAENERASFLGRFKRPSLLLFKDHCNHLIKELSLKEQWLQDAVKAITRAESGWQVQLQNSGAVHCENLVLAIGNSEKLRWPEWATALKATSKAPIHHIFDPLLRNVEDMTGPFTVIGGGITAVHLTLKLTKMFPGQVTLLKRHPFRVHDFDSDPGWLGPKKQINFRKTVSHQNRRNLITQARHKGSIPRDLYIKMLHNNRQNDQLILNAEVYAGKFEGDRIKLYDQSGNLIKETGTVLLATGFEAMLPGKEWLTPVIKENHLQCASCGYPIVTENLEWGSNLYVMGGLAELEIGPIARNISGARQAAERILQTL